MKFLVVTYYEEKESILCACNSLRNIGYEVVSYPLFQYSKDTHSKIPNYLEHMTDFIEDENPDVILWWYLGDVETVKHVYNRFKSRLSLLFNWDDPFVWNILAHSNIDKKAPFFDIAFVSSEHSIELYMDNGTPEAYCLYPGYQPQQQTKTIDYEYDISIGVTNLYEDTTFYRDQYVNRKEFIDRVSRMRGVKVAIFGPEFLKSIYPEQYVGFVNYADLPSMFHKSRINVSLHVCNKNKYINERTILVLGAGELLFVDPVIGTADLLKDGCVFIDKERYTQQIRSILANYDQYESVKKKGHEISKQYTWDKWAEFIHTKISDHPKYLKGQIRSKDDKRPGLSVSFVEKLNINFATFSKVSVILEQIRLGHDIEKNLKELADIYDKNPYMNINGTIQSFIELSE